MLDQGLGIVDHDGLRHPAEVPEGVLETVQQAVGRLPEDRLAVALARVAQDDPKDVRPPPSAVGLDDRRSGAQIDLDFLARRAFHPTHRQRRGLAQGPGKSTNTVVFAGEPVLGDQILMNPLGRKPLIKLGFNDLAERRTFAAAPSVLRPGPGRRFGRF